MKSLQQARMESFFKPNPKAEEDSNNLKRKNEANGDESKKKPKLEIVPLTPPTSVQIDYTIVYIIDETAPDHKPHDDSTIAIYSTDESPHPEDRPANMIPCSADLHYGEWEAEFETNYCTASDTFDKFKLTDAGVPMEVWLYAKRCIEEDGAGEGEGMALSAREKTELGIAVYESEGDEEEKKGEKE
ncbi:MAG: hypothetical protein Q9208_001175 [Pyrenodesmia sp. 3 TL-2023]